MNETEHAVQDGAKPEAHRVLAPAVDLLVTDWYRRVRESQRAHYECGKRYSALNRIFGIPTIVLTATVGTTVFATFNTGATGRMKLFLGLTSVVAAVCASLQTFLTFSERADKHRTAGSRYGAIRRDLEILKTFPPASEADVRKEVEAIKKSMDDLAAGTPNIPGKLKNRIDNHFKKQHRGVIFSAPARDDP